MIVKLKELARMLALAAMITYTILFADLFYTAWSNPGGSIIFATNDIGEGSLEMACILLSLPLVGYLFLSDTVAVGRCVACRLKEKDDSSKRVRKNCP